MRNLETAVAAQQLKLTEVEALAKKKGGLMEIVTRYGAPFVVWYAVMWAGSWFGIYTLLEMGFVSWQDTLPALESFGLGQYVEKVDPSTGNMVLALVINEIIEPIRFPLVLATSKPVIDACRRFATKAM